MTSLTGEGEILHIELQRWLDCSGTQRSCYTTWQVPHCAVNSDVIARLYQGHVVRRLMTPVLHARRKATLQLQCLLKAKLACKTLLALSTERAALQSRCAVA